MSLDLLLLQTATGLALGAVYVLLALGLSLIFGMLTVVNFAHGAFYMCGAYMGLSIAQKMGGFVPALFLAPLVAGALGALSERILIKPLYGRGVAYPMLLTFGLAYIITDAIRFFYGKQGLSFDMPEALQGSVYLGFGYFPLYRLFLIGVTAVVLVAIWALIERTRFGLIVRAGARDPEIVRVLGINIGLVRVAVFALGTALAALAGVLSAPLQGLSPEMGVNIIAEAFVVTVLGGMGSLVGAVVAGLLVGVVSSLTALFAPGWAQVSMFILMALVLLIRPRGLFGKAGLLS